MMTNLQVTAFHLDFSTLQMERGETAISPSGVTCTIQPMIIPPSIRLEGLLIAEDKDNADEKFTKADFAKALGKVSRRIKK